MDGKITVCKYECAIVDNCTKEVITSFTVTGSAKCAPSDSVDEGFGAKLADSRAKLTAYKKAASYYPKEEVRAMMDQIMNVAPTIRFVDQMFFLKKKEADHIAEICKV